MADLFSLLSAQFMQRIESFKALKRHQVDLANRLEFYRSPSNHTGRGLSSQPVHTHTI